MSLYKYHQSWKRSSPLRRLSKKHDAPLSNLVHSGWLSQCAHPILQGLTSTTAHAQGDTQPQTACMTSRNRESVECRTRESGLHSPDHDKANGARKAPLQRPWPGNPQDKRLEHWSKNMPKQSKRSQRLDCHRFGARKGARGGCRDISGAYISMCNKSQQSHCPTHFDGQKGGKTGKSGSKQRIRPKVDHFLLRSAGLTCLVRTKCRVTLTVCWHTHVHSHSRNKIARSQILSLTPA